MQRREALLKAAQCYEKYSEWAEGDDIGGGLGSQQEVGYEELGGDADAELAPKRRQRGNRAGRAVQEQRQRQAQVAPWRVKQEARPQGVQQEEQPSEQAGQPEEQPAVDQQEEQDFCPPEFVATSRKMARILRYGDRERGIPPRANILTHQLARMCGVTPDDIENVVATSLSRGYPRFLLHGRVVIAAPRG